MADTDATPAHSPVGAGSRTHKSCDACKSRKVRCPSAGPPGPCANCTRRKQQCRFSVKKLAHRRNVARQLLPTNYSPSSQRPPSPPNATAVLDLSTSTSDGQTKPEGTETPSPKSPSHRIHELYVDRILVRAQEPKDSDGKAQEDAIRLLSLSKRLRNRKVNELVGRISAVVNGRLRRADPATTTTRKTGQPGTVVYRGSANLYIRLYFERVHPTLPFLDRASFESTIANPNFPSLLGHSKPWTCLYHAVLAIGSQHADGGTFEPGKGESWRLFSVSLGSFSDLLLLPDSLTTLQALTAMSLYALCLCGLSVEPVIVSEAARRAQTMSSHNFTGSAASAYQKAFWSMYIIEKVTSFHIGRSSSFVDCDISCPIPVTSEATIAGFDSFLHLVRLSRLLSRAYTSLFSVGVSGNSSSYYLDVIDQLNVELEAWRASLPDNGFRPGGTVRAQAILEPVARSLAVVLHYLYYSLLLTLSRTMLVYLPASDGPVAVAVAVAPEVAAKRSSNLKTTLDGCRFILELTSMIELEPYTNTWVIAGIPITALFVLFDMVIHDPQLPGTASNLALLDMAAGHFSRIEFVSGGAVPGSLIAEFARIARDYVNEIQHSEQRTMDAAKPPAAVSAMAAQEPAFELQDSQQAPQPDVMQMNLSDPMARHPVMPGPLQSGFVDFSFYNGMDHASPGASMGTNVMGLFSYFLPDLDPMFYQGLTQDYDMLPSGGPVN
ncbi:putative transcriptional regulatory protein [Colletotrichum shisoi]|uniref:Putative transcriptional regulatory protein n=1 Tax=Colletotrichum shisoi TaxID=2078593 RepID=A0A5Q4BMR3_9PEZI|nr:putative transcriptional regulatory protein [Colletotrichum shisoi]